MSLKKNHPMNIPNSLSLYVVSNILCKCKYACITPHPLTYRLALFSVMNMQEHHHARLTKRKHKNLAARPRIYLSIFVYVYFQIYSMFEQNGVLLYEGQSSSSSSVFSSLT